MNLEWEREGERRLVCLLQLLKNWEGDGQKCFLRVYYIESHGKHWTFALLFKISEKTQVRERKKERILDKSKDELRIRERERERERSLTLFADF